VKVDIVDSFEKRIKSRFSHRMTLFYEQTLEKFMENLISVFNELLQKADNDYKREQINILRGVLETELTLNALNYEYECGK
jgi:CRISPR/Cas system CSM-associated protein Csm2 small subunit